MKALELASLCTVVVDFKDWWWKAQIGKCYYKLGLYREAEKQFISSLKIQVGGNFDATATYQIRKW